MIAPVDLGKNALSPRVSDADGVAIIAVARLVPGGLEVWLHGAYQVTVGEAQAIGAVPLQRAVVVTAVNGYAYGTMSLLGPSLAFEDDETLTSGVVRGYFNVELGGRAPNFPWTGAHVVASLGPFVSNVARLVLPK